MDAGLAAQPFGAPMALGAWLRFDAIRRALDHAHPASIVEIGTGTGAMSSRIASAVPYRGYERDEATFATAQRRLGDRVQYGEMTAADSPADMLCAFEVLEHIENDVDALQNWSKFIGPRGWLLLSVPANPDRFGRHDLAVGHFRRYSRESLGTALTEGGYDIASMEMTGAGMGHALQWARDKVAKPVEETPEARTAASGRWHQPDRQWTAPAFYATALAGRAMQYPFRNSNIGRGLVALARRTDAEPRPA